MGGDMPETQMPVQRSTSSEELAYMLLEEAREALDAMFGLPV